TYLMTRSHPEIRNLCRLGRNDVVPSPSLFLESTAWAAACHEPSGMMRSQMGGIIDSQLDDLDKMEKEFSESIIKNKENLHKASDKAYLDLQEKVKRALSDPKGGAITKIPDEDKQRLLHAFTRRPDIDGYVPSATQHERYQQYLERELKDKFPREWKSFREALDNDPYVKNLMAARSNKAQISELKKKFIEGKERLSRLPNGFKVADVRSIYEDLPRYQSDSPKLSMRFSSFNTTLDYFDSSTQGGISGRVRDFKAYHSERASRAVKQAGKRVIKFIPLLGTGAALASPMETLEDNFMLFTTTSTIGCDPPLSQWMVIGDDCQPTYEWSDKAIQYFVMPHEVRVTELNAHPHYYCELTRQLHAQRGKNSWHTTCEPTLTLTSKSGKGRYEIKQDNEGRFIEATFFPQTLSSEIKMHQLVFDSSGLVDSVRMAPQTRYQLRKKKKSSSVEQLFSSPDYYSKMSGRYLRDIGPNRSAKPYQDSYSFFQSQLAAFTDAQACCRGEGSPSECKLYGIAPKGSSLHVPDGWQTQEGYR
ncbi:MAG: hypothetical protein KDD61_15575, partial [Bdellovibrionales bacterium]|nr:hypothetical protein [Bdellovibrionales bacterium]